MQSDKQKDDSEKKPKKAIKSVKAKEALPPKPIVDNEITPGGNADKEYKTQKNEIAVNISENSKGNEQEVIANSLFRKYIIINAIILVATLIIAGAAIYQFFITKYAAQEAARDFNISNAAYLEAEILNVKIAPNAPIKGDIIFRNLGIYPAKIINVRLGCQVSADVPPLFVKNSKITMGTNKYVIKDSPVGFPLDSAAKLPAEAYDKIINGDCKFYIEGYIVYINLVTNGKRCYNFIATINFKNKNMIDFTLNDNYDIK